MALGAVLGVKLLAGVGVAGPGGDHGVEPLDLLAVMVGRDAAEVSPEFTDGIGQGRVVEQEDRSGDGLGDEVAVDLAGRDRVEKEPGGGSPRGE